MPHNLSVVETDRIGKNVTIGEYVVIRSGVQIGDNVIIHPHVVINEGVDIGENVEIFPGAILGKEPNDAGVLVRKPEIEKKLTIGPNSSIGPNAVIFYDVEIGANTVIGAGVIVTKDTSSGSLVMGFPTRASRSTTDGEVIVHNLALLETDRIGRGTRIWAHSHILAGAQIGEDCNICDQTFIENDVIIGNRVTVKCGVHIWDGVRIEDDVFIGPSVSFSNDRFPRSKKYPKKFLETVIKKGASVGANATLLPGITIGENAMIGAGSVVTKDVPDNALVMGNPARIVRHVHPDQSESQE